MSERTEAWMRIPIGIVSGIMLSVWRMLIVVFGLFNFIAVVFTKKRVKDLAELCEIWNTQQYLFIRYMTFSSNKRPFPFDKLAPSIRKFEAK